ncbi:MAG: 1-acyl-sn-glycerol-3-phosphate acyltransferase [Clostridiales bacterium]|jgi:1-acyl-sn-glycerol-3-phosphate acyltransferase|nr:1-acyl-sn-glycerol-3-phosphate acyltransferase [Clostridiales bacterium]
MYTIARYIVLLIYKIVYNLSYEGVENIPKEGGRIYASNHRSYADPVLISLPVRKRFAYMAKEELFKNPFFSALIRFMGAFPVVRGSGDMKVIDEAIARLNKGRNLVIFPEGTRSKDGRVGRGKTGVALIAAKANVDVIPVAIVFEGKLKFRKKVVVKYGKPISASQLQIGDKLVPSELKKLKNMVMESITELVDYR